jgi:uncharacterized protein YecE (DUF72 family)
VAKRIYVGMSGWTYDAWRGDFYPKGLVHRRELEYASRQVTSIEINGTFYALQKPATFQRWYDETPEDFRFAVKAPQYITHIRRLKDVAEPVANFFASGLLCLGEKMGPILWQFPPSVMLKDDRFETFLKLLPYDLKSAAKIAKKHTDKVAGRSFTEVKGNAPVRHAIEVRHESFRDPAFIKLLRAHGVAIVFAHSGEKSPYMEDLTADFIYARMHGQEYKKGYPPKFLDQWSERLKTWTAGLQPKDAECVVPTASKVKSSVREAYVYFDTEAKAYAPQDALNLIARLKSNR